jgi:hypothetical protein
MSSLDTIFYLHKYSILNFVLDFYGVWLRVLSVLLQFYMKNLLFSRKSSKAFTLVELATVLLIVAALVASILSGKALKDSADISTIIDNVKKIDASAITFSSIYGGIPGTVDPMVNTALQANVSYTGSTGSVSTVYNPIYDTTTGALLISKEYFNKSIVYNAVKFNPVFESWRHISLSGVLPNIQSKVGTHACDGTVATLACTGSTMGANFEKSSLAICHQSARFKPKCNSVSFTFLSSSSLVLVFTGVLISC